MADYNINAVTRKVVYTGSAGTGPYAFSFEVLVSTDVAVYFNTTLLTLSTDYSVTVNANGTGSVTIITGTNVPTTPDANDAITIVGARDIERTTDFSTGGDFQAVAINEQLDANIIFIQQIDERVDRSIKAAVTDPTSIDMELPIIATRANKVMAFDSSGNVSVSTNTLSAIEGTIATTAASAAAALVSENAAAASESAAAADLILTNADVVLAAAEAASAAVSAASAAASAAGIYWKAPVLVSSTANLTLSGAQTIDGISAVAGDRVLVKDQTAPAENGIYIVAAGAWSRAVPMDTWDEHVGAVVLVSQGSLGENKAYQCTVNAGGTLDTTAITWASFGAVAIDFVVDTFVDVTDYTSGTTTALTLSAEAGSEQNITVTFDGVTQHHNQFSLSGTTLTFTEAIPLGVDSVEVKLGSSLGIGTPSDGTVTEAKIATSAVTEAKIATSAVTVTKIADDAITLAKMAGGTDGNLITYDASGDPAYVATGTAGQVLTSGGAGVAPTMQDAAGGMGTLIGSVDVSGSPSTIDFDGLFTSDYNIYKLEGSGIRQSSASDGLRIRFKSGGSFQTSNYMWQIDGIYNGGTALNNGSASDAQIVLTTRGSDAAAGDATGFSLTLYDPLGTDYYKTITSASGGRFSTYPFIQNGYGAWRGGTGAVTGIQVLGNGITYAGGKFRLYGLNAS